MAALTQNRTRKFGVSEGPHSNEPIRANTKIYMGAVVGDDGSGYRRGLVAGDTFRGFAWALADNNSSVLNPSLGAAGALEVELRLSGEVTLNVVGVTGVTDAEDTVYASDEDTFTKSASNSASPIGKVLRWISGTLCVVYFESAPKRSL